MNLKLLEKMMSDTAQSSVQNRHRNRHRNITVTKYGSELPTGSLRNGNRHHRHLLSSGLEKKNARYVITFCAAKQHRNRDILVCFTVFNNYICGPILNTELSQSLHTLEENVSQAVRDW